MQLCTQIPTFGHKRALKFSGHAERQDPGMHQDPYCHICQISYYIEIPDYGTITSTTKPARRPGE